MAKEPSVLTIIRRRFAHLQAVFPTPYPTVLQFTSKLGRNSGTCGEVVRKKKTMLMIQIASDLPRTSALDCLFHEFAHAMTWRVYDDDDNTDHGPRWGICMADIYTWYDDTTV